MALDLASVSNRGYSWLLAAIVAACLSDFTYFDVISGELQRFCKLFYVIAASC